jgi:hypothetical protein
MRQLRVLAVVGLFLMGVRAEAQVTTMTTRLSASTTMTFSKITDLSNPTATVALSSALSLANGITNVQADQGWGKVDTIAASGTRDWDFRGALTNVLGGTFIPVEVVLCQVTAASGNTNNVVVGNVTNGMVLGFAAATQSWSIPPGGGWLWWNPVGYGTTAGTVDLLHVANSSSGTSVIYSIVCAGRSA